MGAKENIEDERKTGMDRVKEFDEKLLRMDNDRILIRRMAAYFFEVLVTMVVVIYCSESKWQAMHWIVAFCYSFTIMMHINVYMIIYENYLTTDEDRHAISIYQLLKKFPVNPRDIFKVRLIYLWRMLYKRWILLYIIQLPFFICQNHVTLINIVYPVFVVATAAIICVFGIRPKG